jgi:hypothetical protein
METKVGDCLVIRPLTRRAGAEPYFDPFVDSWIALARNDRAENNEYKIDWLEWNDKEMASAFWTLNGSKC